MIYFDAAIIAAFMFCVIRNENPLRFWVAYCVLVVTALNIVLFYTSLYDLAVGVMGFHVYQSLFDVALILLLALRPSKLGILVMGVSVASIFVNMLSYWVDLYGDSSALFQVLMWGLFAVQVALLLSKRLTNGVHGSLASISIVYLDPRRMYQRTTESQSK